MLFSDKRTRSRNDELFFVVTLKRIVLTIIYTRLVTSNSVIYFCECLSALLRQAFRVGEGS